MRARTYDFRKLDIERFAREEASVDEGLPLASLPRVVESCHVDCRHESASRELRWQAGGEMRTPRGDAAQAWVRLSARISLPLECQRCLRPVACEVEFDRWFRFARDEAQAAALDAEVEEDVLALSRSFDLLGLLEDELLLALPLVPRHAQCVAPLPAAQPLEPAADDRRPNPFDVLAALKQPPKSGH